TDHVADLLIGSYCSVRPTGKVPLNTGPTCGACARLSADPDLGDRHPAQHMNPFGQRIDQLQLLIGVLVQQQMQLLEGRPAHLPVLLLVLALEDQAVSQDNELASVMPLEETLEVAASVAVPQYYAAYEKAFDLPVYRPIKVIVVCDRGERLRVETDRGDVS